MAIIMKYCDNYLPKCDTDTQSKLTLLEKMGPIDLLDEELPQICKKMCKKKKKTKKPTVSEVHSIVKLNKIK